MEKLCSRLEKEDVCKGALQYTRSRSAYEMKWQVVLSLGAFALFCDLHRPATTSAEAAVAERDLVGPWYMGTMTGQDCNLKLQPGHRLEVQNGGCFNTDKPLVASWDLKSDKILFSDKDLRSQFGSYLLVVSYKNNLVLVPEKQRASVQKHGYVHYFCFWKNLMKNGLRLPHDADVVRAKYFKESTQE